MKTLLTLLLLATAVPAAKADYCRPYVTHTCVVCSRTECRWATDHCGRRYSYHVRVVTYRSYYSNGQTSTFARSYRA
jgi:hypothetical protein